MNNLKGAGITRLLLITCMASLSIFAQRAEKGHRAKSQDDETAVKAVVESFLVALGDDDQEKIKTMFLPNANIASISAKNDEYKIYTASANQYMAQREGKQNRKFKEPVRKYTVNISQGLLAFVRADAMVYYNDVASHHTNDFFILMKDNGVWKILSGSYTTEPVEKGN